MKRFLIPVLTILFCAPVPTVSVQAEECTAPVISAPPVWPPFILPGGDNGLRNGIGVDYSIHLLQQLGLSPVLDESKPWARVLKELENGEIDIVFTLLDDPERRKIFQYTEAWATDDYGVITQRGKNLVVEDVSDLKKYYGAYLHGVRFPPPLNQVMDFSDRTTFVTNIESLYHMLSRDRVDYLVVSTASFFALVPDPYEPEEFEEVKALSVRVPVYMAISNKSPCVEILDQLNDQIRNTSLESLATH